MRSTVIYPAKHCRCFGQHIRCELYSLPTIKVDVGKAVARSAKDYADVLRVAVEVLRHILFADDAFFPAVVDRLRHLPRGSETGKRGWP